MIRAIRIIFVLMLLSAGCRSVTGKSTSYSGLDLSIGMLPTGISLNANQNRFPPIAGLMDAQDLFKSVEPVAASPDKQFDLILMTGPGQLSTWVTIRSGYSNKELFKTKVFALYGGGWKRAIRKIYKAFKLGKPAYQEIMAERRVWRSRHGRPGSPAGTVSKEEIAEIVRSAVKESGKPKTKGFTFISDVDSPAYRERSRPKDVALVIGIEKYSTLPAAQYAERDAWAMRNHFVAMGIPERNIVHLSGSAASRSGLVKTIETWLPNNVKRGSTVFVYFSGHGAPDVKTGEGYLVPWDGDPQYLKDTGYSMARLYKKLNALKVKRVFVALDACFSGAGGRSVLAKGTRPLVTKVTLGDAGSGKLVSLSAAAADQTSGTIDSQGHGVFTYYLLRGLNGAAKDMKGYITAKSLHDYLAPNVEDVSRRDNREQKPQIRGGQGGMRIR